MAHPHDNLGAFLHPTNTRKETATVSKTGFRPPMPRAPMAPRKPPMRPTPPRTAAKSVAGGPPISALIGLGLRPTAAPGARKAPAKRRTMPKIGGMQARGTGSPFLGG